MKYKIGDKVRVKTWERLIKEYGLKEDVDGEYILIKDKGAIFDEDMKKFCGKVVTIDNIIRDTYVIAEDDWYWVWTDEMFEGKV